MITLSIVMCAAGAYSYSNSLFNIWVLVISGGISYILFKLGFPAVPIVLGYILGPIAETNLRSSLIMSDGSWLIFLTRPICIGFILLTIFLLVLLRRQRQRELRQEAAALKTLENCPSNS